MHATALVADDRTRAEFQALWVQSFPTPGRAPALQITRTQLPPGAAIELKLMAVAGEQRQGVVVSGWPAPAGAPHAVRVGNRLFSSTISADDPVTGLLPDGVTQIDQCFRNLQGVVEDTGGTVDDIVLIWMYLSDFNHQADMMERWVGMFPDEGNRPARKTVPHDLGPGRLFEMQCIAVIGGGRRNYELPGRRFHDRIPLGSAVGTLFCSSGIPGTDENRAQTPSEPGAQAEIALRNAEAILHIAGGSLESLGLITALVGDYTDVPSVRRAFDATFPDPANQPALHCSMLGANGQNRVQLHLVGLL